MKQFDFLQNIPNVPKLTPEEYLLHQCRRFNSEPGKLTGYDCPECLNRGVIAAPVDGRFTVHECRCMKKREVLRQMAKSGIRKFHRFEDFRAEDLWQQRALVTAQEFLDTEKKWFFIGGQPGCGKTHLCTAILSGLLDRGRSGRYMLWRDESVHLKANINDPSYRDMILPLKNVDVLYIDDLFKTQSATGADLGLAFEILNARYLSEKTTVISSEHTVGEILEMDEAVGSRIYDMSRGFCFVVPSRKEKNWRLKN